MWGSELLGRSVSVVYGVVLSRNGRLMCRSLIFAVCAVTGVPQLWALY